MISENSEEKYLQQWPIIVQIYFLIRSIKKKHFVRYFWRMLQIICVAFKSLLSATSNVSWNNTM